jgi:putative transposase
LIERSFEEHRRRTKTPHFFTEKSGFKLAFAVLWRASLRWRRIRFSEHEKQQLAKLRKILGLEPMQPARASSGITENSLSNSA